MQYINFVVIITVLLLHVRKWER